MHVLVKRFRAGNARRTVGRERGGGIAQQQIAPVAPASCLCDNLVEPRIGPKRNFVQVARQFKMRAGRGVIGQVQKTIRQPELQFG